jgi:hypothetical protein
MSTITVNPIDNGTNIISAADAAAGVTFSGSETGLDGQQIGVELEKGYGNTRFLGAVPPAVGANGTWSTILSPGDVTSQSLIDGIYTADADAVGAADAIETVIVAEHATAFEVVGLAFNDVNQQLVTEPFILSIAQELGAEKAGLQTLLDYGAFPAKPVNNLINDISKEQNALNFTPQSVGYADPKTIAKIELIQQKMADLVHDTPALVAQQPDGIGWTSPINPPVTASTVLLLGQYMAGNFHITNDGTSGTLVTEPPLVAATPNLIALVASHV